MKSKTTLFTEEVKRSNYPDEHPWSITIKEEAWQNKVLIRQGGHGIRPVFISEGSVNRFLGSSFVELATACEELNPNPIGRLSLLCLGRCVGEHTLVKEVRRLPPGDRHTITGEGVFSHWHDALCEDEPGTVESVVDRYIEAIGGLIPEETTGWLPLTGGVDSRVLASFVSRAPGLRSYTRGIKTSGECATAAKVARATHISHRAYPFDRGYLEKYALQVVKLTGGMTSFDNGHAIHPLGKLHRVNGDVIIPGINGEYGRSFWSSKMMDEGISTPEEAGVKVFSVESIIRKKEFCELLTDEALALHDELKAGYVKLYQDAAACARYDHPIAWNDEFYLRNRVRTFTSHGATIWNTRFKLLLPYMEDGCIQAMRMLPPRFRTQPLVHMKIIQKMNRELLNIPLFPSGMPMQPGKLDRLSRFTRRTLGRIAGRKPEKSPQNYDNWLRRERKFIAPFIDNAENSCCGLIRTGEIKRLWDEHLAGTDHHRILCRVLTLAMLDKITTDMRGRKIES